MPTFDASIEIAAPPDEVWATLVQTDRWPDWDPKLDRVEGRLDEGGSVTIHVIDQSRAFPLKVTSWRPGTELVLRGGMPLGLFAGTRTYSLAPSPSGTSFRMVERYSGPLAGLIGRSIPDLQPSFDAFVAGLRDAVQAP